MNYRTILGSGFDPEQPRHGAYVGMSMDEYRNAPGFAPSDLKLASDDYGFKAKGHPLKLGVDRLRRWFEANPDAPQPVWMDDFSEKRSDHFSFGELYHCLLLTPDAIADQIAVIDAERIEGFVAEAKERKVKDAPQSYSARLKEAQAFKKANDRLPETDEEKASILAAAQERFVGAIEFHSRLTEFEVWKQEQEQAGRLVVGEREVNRAKLMIEQLHNEPENSEVGEYLKAMKLSADRVEVSLFAEARFSRVEGAPSIQLKGRPDCIPAGDALIDPKSALSVSMDQFGKQCDQLGWDFSMAGYITLTEILAGETNYDFPKTRAGFLAQEKVYPYLARIYFLPDDWLSAAKAKYQAACLDLCNQWSRQEFSTPMMREQISELVPSPWKAREIAEFGF